MKRCSVTLFSRNVTASRVFYEMVQRQAFFMKWYSTTLFVFFSFFHEMVQRHAFSKKRCSVMHFPRNGTASCVFHEIVHHEWMTIYIWRVKTSTQKLACPQLWCFSMKQNIITLFSDDKLKNLITKRNKNRLLREFSAYSRFWIPGTVCYKPPKRQVWRHLSCITFNALIKWFVVSDPD